MAKPRILVSSSCEDLYIIREQLRNLIEEMGYESVLSEEGDVYYSPDLHVHLSCIREVQNCDMVILIVGNRFGSEFVSSPNKSVTQAEHDTAYVSTIPIFAFIEHRVLHDYSTYHRLITQAKGKENNPELLLTKIPFGSQADIKVFKFIDDIKRKVTNNAYFPFRDFADIKEAMKKQWAGMLFDFLRQRRERTENQRIISLLTQIDIASTKVEQIIGLVAENTVSPDKLTHLKAIDTATNEKRLHSILLDIWQAFSLNRRFLSAAQALGQGELEEIYSMLLRKPSSKEPSTQFIIKLQVYLMKLGFVAPDDAFVDFSIDFRLAELREANKRFKFKKNVMLKAIKNTLVAALSKTSDLEDARGKSRAQVLGKHKDSRASKGS
jgi:hypothetical protein